MAIRVPTVTAGVPPSVLPARPRAARAERFVFPSGLRWAATAYVVATIPLCAYLAADVRGQRGYITTFTLVARLRVTIGATGDRLTAEVLDDGVGIGGAQPGRGIDSMEVVAGFVDGELAITEAPGGGTRVVATVDIGPPPSPTRRPQLRVVGDR